MSSVCTLAAFEGRRAGKDSVTGGREVTARVRARTIIGVLPVMETERGYKMIR